ncbi:acetolactate synthase 2 catalytic subunit [Klebsiella pneumoniae]|nr:acetolactate synthase 2 catalytic subunit [Klebsiella pneumoniae]
MNGAQWVVHTLRTQGVDTVFGYPGGAIMPVYDALYDGGVEHLLCRHEQGAAMAAIGYARATGKTGVCIATSGPGATNLITGLADALLDSIPIVAITGQVAAPFIGTDAFQEVDVLGLSLACTKHSFLVQSLDELPRVIAEAFQVANSGRPGPVLVDIPKDIQMAQGDLDPHFSTVADEMAFPQAEVAQALQMLAQSQQPMLYVGGGVGMAQAVPALREFLAVTRMPATCTLKGLGVVDADYPYYLGMLGMHGTKAANLAVQECDLLIAVGARFDDRVTGKLNTFAPHAKVIHMDIDPAELNKLRQAHIGLTGDLNCLLPALQQPLAIDGWRERSAALRAEHAWRYDHPGEAIYAPLLLKQLSDRKPADSVVTTDVGQHQMWTAQAYPLNRPRQWLTSGGLGTMGFGLPAAIGAALANPQRKVICFSGDGSLMMNIQEMATAAENQLDVKIILLNNEALGLVHQQQSLFYQQGVFAATYPGMINFMQIAAGFGLQTCDLNNEVDPQAALQAIIDRPGPALIHVRIDAQQKVYPMVPPGAANTEMVGE